MTMTKEIAEDWHDLFPLLCRKYFVVQFSHGRDRATTDPQNLGGELVWAIGRTSGGQSEVLGHWEYMGSPASALPGALADLYRRGLEGIRLVLLWRTAGVVHMRSMPGPTVGTWHEIDSALASDERLTASQRRAAYAISEICARVTAAMCSDGRVQRRLLKASAPRMAVLEAFLAHARVETARAPRKVAKPKVKPTANAQA